MMAAQKTIAGKRDLLPHPPAGVLYVGPCLLILAPPQSYGGSKQTGNIVDVRQPDGCQNGSNHDNDGKKNIDEPWNARGQASRSRSASRPRYHCGKGGSACNFPLACVLAQLVTQVINKGVSPGSDPKLQYLFSFPICSYVDVVQKNHCFCDFCGVDKSISGKVNRWARITQQKNTLRPKPSTADQHYFSLFSFSFCFAVCRLCTSKR